MFSEDSLISLYVIWAFFFQAVLILHFALRRWAFERYIYPYGWIVYALSIPAAVVSVMLLANGADYGFWLGGFIYLAWAAYGYTVEYVRRITWRSPIRWNIFGPYILGYLAVNMFYWFPLGLIRRELWMACGVLFAISTLMNVLSHKPAGGNP